MSFNMNLWKVKDKELKEISKFRLDSEDRLETWIAKDSSITGLDMLIIGRQVVTTYGGRIDLLGMDIEGNVIILELKRDKTPRDIVAQALDYASWVKDLSYNQIETISSTCLHKSLRDSFREKFQSELPNEINRNHSIVIVASELDPSSERIVQYLSTEYGVNINCIFFDFFKDGDQELLGRSWLMDPEEMADKRESKKTTPWSGLYFVNVGDGYHRSWEDCRTYGFLSAGQGERYIKAMKRLNVGDRVLAYISGKGYVGYGEVTSTAVVAKDLILPNNTRLFDNELVQPNIKENCDNPDLTDWPVGVKWITTFKKTEAVTKPGIFANQNVVCKLRDQTTIDFLDNYFNMNSAK